MNETVRLVIPAAPAPATAQPAPTTQAAPALAEVIARNTSTTVSAGATTALSAPVRITSVTLSSTVSAGKEDRGATVFGQSMHLLVEAGMSGQLMRDELAKVGIAQADIRPIAPSLEDVFVALTSERLNGGPQ